MCVRGKAVSRKFELVKVGSVLSKCKASSTSKTPGTRPRYSYATTGKIKTFTNSLRNIHTGLLELRKTNAIQKPITH
jgi:hypothetical protein